MDWSRDKEIISNRIEIANHGAGMSRLDEWWEEMTQILFKDQSEIEKFLEERIK